MSHQETYTIASNSKVTLERVWNIDSDMNVVNAYNQVTYNNDCQYPCYTHQLDQVSWDKQAPKYVVSFVEKHLKRFYESEIRMYAFGPGLEEFVNELQARG